jgi:CTP synthase
VIEFARNVLGHAGANSTEMDAATPWPVIDMMEEQKSKTEKGGTMRLGSYPCKLSEGSLSAAAYGTTSIKERHRHRYEFNGAYTDEFRKAGLVPAGTNPQTKLVEVVELKDHPWFVGVQYHPEYKSTVARPHPLFTRFVAVAVKHQAAHTPPAKTNA